MNQSATGSKQDRASLGSIDDVVIEPGGGFLRLQVLICGLQSANILLSIMSSSGIDRRAVEDDTIEACVNLIKNQIQKNLVPALSNSGHLGNVRAVASNGSEETSNRVDDDAGQTPKAKRPKTVPANRGVVAKGLKTVYTPILSTIGLLGTILERTQNFINGNEMDDRLLFTLSSAALSTLTIDAAPVVRADVGSLTSIVHESAIDLVIAIFGRYPRHQSVVIEDLFQLLLKLPTSKKSLRTYLIRNTASTAFPPIDSVGHNNYIQPICALALLLIQSCVVVPVLPDNGDMKAGSVDTANEDVDSDDEEELASKANETSGLERCYAVCERITSEMLQRCSRKGEEGGASEFRPILFNWIDDLLCVRNLIEFPAAEMLLLNLSHRVSAAHLISYKLCS
jgi:cohesin loading factor subunit SCC2